MTSFRPLTRFTRLVLGDDPNTKDGSKKNFPIKLLSQISVYIELNALRDELSIEADQNLQKFLFSDSDGTTLRFYLDSYDDNSHDPLQLDSTNQNKSSSTSLIKLDSGPDAHNFIKSNDKIKVYLKTSGSFVDIVKRNFSVVNLYVRLNRNPIDFVQHNSFNKFNCNGQVLFDNVFVLDSNFTASSLVFSSIKNNQNVFAYMCSEQFDLRVSEKDHVVEFSAHKIN